jgi:hypothetical protein
MSRQTAGALKNRTRINIEILKKVLCSVHVQSISEVFIGVIALQNKMLSDC